jgi:hypothetical protein
MSKRDQHKKRQAKARQKQIEADERAKERAVLEKEIDGLRVVHRDERDEPLQEITLQRLLEQPRVQALPWIRWRLHRAKSGKLVGFLSHGQAEALFKIAMTLEIDTKPDIKPSSFELRSPGINTVPIGRVVQIISMRSHYHDWVARCEREGALWRLVEAGIATGDKKKASRLYKIDHERFNAEMIKALDLYGDDAPVYVTKEDILENIA